MNPRGRRKEREGVVTSDRMQKTVIVSLERLVRHSKYGKYFRRRTRVKAHDEKSECRVGDRVIIVETRPLSREKRWRVSRVVARTVEMETVPATEQEVGP